MHVILVEPAFPRNQREFARALAATGARVSAIGEAPTASLDDELRSWLSHYEPISSVVNEAALLAAVRKIQGMGWVDRLETTIEAHILPAAHVREKCGIPGTSVKSAYLCRDKPAMKEALRQAGVPCAASDGVKTIAAGQAFAARVGYPLIIKPRDAAGAAGTYRVDNDAELLNALKESGVDQGRSAAIEEFIEGHEGFYDTISVDGEPVHEFACHYYPNVLEGMRERWISPTFIATNRLEAAPGYDEVRTMSRKVVSVLGLGTTATHMEWFYGPKGLKFSEIGCRPPGVGAWDVYCAGNEMDVYGEWARAIVGLAPKQRPTRRFSAGMIALRPDRDGRIASYSGVEAIQQRHGASIVDMHFPAAGSSTQPVEAGFMANAWMRLRHPDYDQLRAIMKDVGETIKIHAR
jgi:carbamoylphosphate synthase large subunit